MAGMDGGGLEILHQRCAHQTSETRRAAPSGIQSARGRFFILYTRTAHVLSITGRADCALESLACTRSKSAPSIQTGQVATSRCDVRMPQRGVPTRSQFPICAIPAQHLFNVRDVVGKQVVEENPLFPVHSPFVRYDVSV